MVPTRRPITELLGVPDVPTEGRARILAAALELFYERGLQAVGIDQVVDRAGVTKTTFYRHFEGKDELMVAAVTQRDLWETEAWERAVRTLVGEDPRSQLLAVFDVLDWWFNDESFRGCLFLNTACEFPNPHHPVHKAAAAHMHRSREHYARLASRAGAEDPEGLADHYTALLEGTLVLRQVLGRDDAARVMKPLVERLLADRLPPAAPERGGAPADRPAPG